MMMFHKTALVLLVLFAFLGWLVAPDSNQLAIARQDLTTPFAERVLIRQLIALGLFALAVACFVIVIFT